MVNIAHSYLAEFANSSLAVTTLADAILDNIIHNSYQVLIDGMESMTEEVKALPRKALSNDYFRRIY